MRITDERLAELERSFAHVSANVDGTKLPIGDLIADLEDARTEIADREKHFRDLQNTIANVDCVVCQTCVGLNYVIADGMFCCCEECAEAVKDGAY